MNTRFIRALLLMGLALWLLACEAIAAPATSTPAPTSTAANTLTPRPTVTPIPTITPTPWPSGLLDTGMGGDLTISGVVKDDLGHPVSQAFVQLTVYGEGGGSDFGQFANLGLYTDASGAYAFSSVVRLTSGVYELWFNGAQEYGKHYENSGFRVPAGRVTRNQYALDVTVHPVTDSSLIAMVQYIDVDNATRDFYAPADTQPEPGHVVELWRGPKDRSEYPIGVEYGVIQAGLVEWDGLAGGTYHLEFTYRRSDGVLMQCRSSTFEILPGETHRLDYIIRNCAPAG